MQEKYILLNSRQLCDLEMIMNNSFNPLNGFMKKEDYESVVNNTRLKNGTVWPLPITLSVNEKNYEEGETVILCNEDNMHIASMKIESVYVPDLLKECKNCYGTDDTNHPYVNIILSQGKVYNLGGAVTKINNVPHYDYSEIRFEPNTIKETIKQMGYKTVVGFQTRNPMHRSHFELTQKALRDSEDPDAVLFLNPVVGITQDCDIDYHTRVKCYKKILPYYDNKVILSLLPLSMRMAGPKEALLHAIVRKNYGCTHFIVGRDHAGPSSKTKEGNNFYGPYEAQELLYKYKDEIGITPLTSKMMVYVQNKKTFLPSDEVNDDDTISEISGSQQRKMLQNNEPIPEWFTYPEISKILKDEFISPDKKGFCVYIIGLSSSGKTTVANALKQRLQELTTGRQISLLDGDIIRKNLSKGLGFSREDRSTNVRRIGYVASEIVKHNGIVICANIAPYEEDRTYNRHLITNHGHYIEVFMDTPLAVCEDRDVKGLYALARNGVLKEFTGISDPFNKPLLSDITISHQYGVMQCTDIILKKLREKQLILD